LPLRRESHPRAGILCALNQRKGHWRSMAYSMQIKLWVHLHLKSVFLAQTCNERRVEKSIYCSPYCSFRCRCSKRTLNRSTCCSPITDVAIFQPFRERSLRSHWSHLHRGTRDSLHSFRSDRTP
jgi:hypothetical protein